MPLSRSQNMSRIRGANTAPERIVRNALTKAGVRYRLQMKTPGGRADLVVPSRKFALFIDGCFWHGCPEHYVHPRSNAPFWDRKLRENVDRDRRQTRELLDEGWRFLRVWEHEVHEAPLKVVEQIKSQLNGGRRRAVGWRVVAVSAVPDGSGVEQRTHEDLLNAERKLTTIRPRITRKTGRVAAGRRTHLSDPIAKKPRRETDHGRKSERNGTR